MAKFIKLKKMTNSMIAQIYNLLKLQKAQELEKFPTTKITNWPKRKWTIRLFFIPVALKL